MKIIEELVLSKILFLMVQKKIDVGGKDAGNGVLINEVTACTECPVE